MDQTALQALLCQLKQQDQPEDGEVSFDVVNAGVSDDTAAVTSEIQGNSELERLLTSLRPVTQDSFQSDDPPELPYGAAYLDILTSASADLVAARQPEKPQQHVDLRKLTFAQALPYITKLASDPAFLESLQQLKSQQELVELNIVDERNRAKADLEKQLKRATDAAAKTGDSYNYDVDRLSKLLSSTLTKFDKAALERWDNTAREQQARLEQLGVPCFYVLKTPDAVAQERQRKVMEMLNQLLVDA